MSIAKNTIINIASATAPLLIALLTIPKYLELIGAENYGIIAIILTIQSYFSFMDLGLGKSVTKEISKSNPNNNEWHCKIYWTATIAIGAISGITSAIIISLLSLSHNINLFGINQKLSNETIGAILIAIACAPILLISSVNIGALQAKQMFGKISIIQTIGSIASQTAPLVIAYNGHIDLRILIASTLAARIISLLWLIKTCRDVFTKHRKIDFNTKIFKRLINYGGWISAINFLSPLLTIIDRSIIGLIKGPIAVSAYTIPYDLVSRSMIISSSFSSALFPRLATEGNIKGSEIAKKSSAILNFASTSVVILSIIGFDTFLKFWVNSENHANSQGIGEILLIGVWINSLVIPYHTNFISNNNPKKIVIIFAIEIPIYLILLYAGIKTLGPIGAAYAWTARVLIDAAILLKLNNAISNNLKSTTSSAIFILFAFIISKKIDEIILLGIFAIALLFTYILIELRINEIARITINNFIKKQR
ncbi:oligosaccharide flippase family protein [Malikia granosa]|uniref:Flippase n=1 Tax=Malikia granosa TaxID=263067 RepID=A0A2S9K6I4_9BURK|nr:oligosaccharide flippase family protein [Malikia granosa]PRD66070.1 hypothetical protein C6P64_05990 [Malikia granosa]